MEKKNKIDNTIKKNIIIISFYIICRRGWSLGSSLNTLSHTNKAGKGAILSIYKFYIIIWCIISAGVNSVVIIKNVML